MYPNVDGTRLLAMTAMWGRNRDLFDILTAWTDFDSDTFMTNEVVAWIRC